MTERSAPPPATAGSSSCVAVPDHAAVDAAQNPPEGYARMKPYGAFHEYVGPMYFRVDEHGQTSVGMRVAPHHLNLGQVLHGGMLCMLADTALTFGCGQTSEPPVRTLTTGITLQIAWGAQLGDWVEARIEMVRIGKRVGFPTCMFWCNGQKIGHASGTFQVMGVRPA